MAVEVVVCRHGENLAWIRNLPKDTKVTIYEKTPWPEAPWPDSIVLPNVGREAHAWLHHLTERYDSLAEWTVFTQGHPFDHAPDMHRVIRNLVNGRVSPKDFLWLGFLWETDDDKGRPSFVNWTKNPERRELHLQDFFRALWSETAPEKIRYVGGGQFVLARQTAQHRSRAFYARARTLAAEFPDAAHAFERTWDRVFLAPPLDPSLFGPSGLRLLKPVKPKPSGEAALPIRPMPPA